MTSEAKRKSQSECSGTVNANMITSGAVPHSATTLARKTEPVKRSSAAVPKAIAAASKKMPSTSGTETRVSSSLARPKFASAKKR